MAFREATLQDIPQIQIVRHAVKENVLSDSHLVTDEDCWNENHELFNSGVLFFFSNRGEGTIFMLQGGKGICKRTIFEIHGL